MLAHCIFCHAPLPHNGELRHFPLGVRVAFDARRGRLWAVCAECRRWNLAPFEERWEAIEELERWSADEARVLARTDNVELLRGAGLEVVRVGQANRAEEAWWRYGGELLRRQRTWRWMRVADRVGIAASFLMVGLPVMNGRGEGMLVQIARRRSFGTRAIRGRSACPRCKRPGDGLRFRDLGKLHLVPGGEHGVVGLYHSCPACRGAPGSGHLLAGTAAEDALRRSLAYLHFQGAAEGEIRDAAAVVDGSASALDFVRGMARRRPRLAELSKEDRTIGVALEIALNDEVERALLEGEVKLLEARWKVAEEIAAIADGELTFFPTPPPRGLAGGQSG
ncbi:MAG TPA: hypothetical protein VE913_25010 [Longimicrobium sp.]|nr:hypothetical protein [Longimicrobium sp.]